MICKKCGHQSPDGTSFCPACGKRLVDREWTISGWLVAIAAACLVLLGAGGTWVAVARHRSPATPIPMPTVAVIPDAVKPSPAVNTDTNSDSQDTSEVFKNFAPPKNTTATKVQPLPESKSDTAKNQSLATSIAPNKIRVSRSFGPVQFQLPAHRKIVNPFSVPDGLSDAHFQAMIVSAGGFGGHLRVIVLHDKTPVFDSGNSFQSKVDIPVAYGSYSLIIENTAIALPRSIMIQGKISGQRR